MPHGFYGYLACHWRPRLSFPLARTLGTNEAEPPAQASGHGITAHPRVLCKPGRHAENRRAF